MVTGPDLQRPSHTTKTILKLSTFQNLPLQKDILEYPPSIRLGSRHPIRHTEVPEESIERIWKERWELAEIHNKTLVPDPTIKVPGWDFIHA